MRKISVCDVDFCLEACTQMDRAKIHSCFNHGSITASIFVPDIIKSDYGIFLETRGKHLQSLSVFTDDDIFEYWLKAARGLHSGKGQANGNTAMIYSCRRYGLNRVAFWQIQDFSGSYSANVWNSKNSANQIGVSFTTEIKDIVVYGIKMVAVAIFVVQQTSPT